MSHPSPARPVKARCPHGRLEKLVMQKLPPCLRLRSSGLKPWASASFVGARHYFLLDQVNNGEAPEALERLIDQLLPIWKEMEWQIAVHIVADLNMTPDDAGGLRLEILSVEE